MACSDAQTQAQTVAVIGTLGESKRLPLKDAQVAQCAAVVFGPSSFPTLVDLNVAKRHLTIELAAIKVAYHIIQGRIGRYTEGICFVLVSNKYLHRSIIFSELLRNGGHPEETITEGKATVKQNIPRIYGPTMTANTTKYKDRGQQQRIGKRRSRSKYTDVGINRRANNKKPVDT